MQGKSVAPGAMSRAGDVGKAALGLGTGIDGLFRTSWRTFHDKHGQNEQESGKTEDCDYDLRSTSFKTGYFLQLFRRLI